MRLGRGSLGMRLDILLCGNKGRLYPQFLPMEENFEHTCKFYGWVLLWLLCVIGFRMTWVRTG